MSLFLGCEVVGGKCHDALVPTIEGALIAKWRDVKGLTQEQLGQNCPHAVAGKDISRYETGSNSLNVRTLLNVVNGLEVPGEGDAWRLAAFFAGPDAEAIDAAREALREHEESSRRTRNLLERLAGRGRRR